MSNRIEGERTASHDDVVNRVACPYCKVNIGGQCLSPKTKTAQEKPHLSRAIRYFRELKREDGK